jgi:hypothetical protein
MRSSNKAWTAALVAFPRQIVDQVESQKSCDIRVEFSLVRQLEIF